MHEFSIAASLVEKLSELVRENPDKRIFEVRLEIGELSHIEHDQLRFCYESITKETPLEGSSLKLTRSKRLWNDPALLLSRAAEILGRYSGRCPRCDLSMPVVRQDCRGNTGQRMRYQVGEV